MMKRLLIIIIAVLCSSLSINSRPFRESGERVYTIKVRGVSFQMVKVEGGIFDMGPEQEQTYRTHSPYGLEFLTHEERVNSFFIGQTEVTQKLWKAVMGRNTSKTDPPYVGDSLPVLDLNYEGCIEFIDRLNQLTKLRFRLPTEAEWEFAARGGLKSKGYRFAGSDNIDDVAWWGFGHAGNRIHAVATKQPNELGLYDMSGNIDERCSDEVVMWDNYRNEVIAFGQRVDSGEIYVTRGHAIRGGGMQTNEASRCTVTSRYVFDPRPAGLRLVLDTSDSDKGIYTIKNEDGVKLDYIKMTESTVALTYNEKRDADISGTLHIPAIVSIKGQQYKVTTIGDKALSNNPRLKAVYIPATVNRIGIHALTNCDNLEQIVVDGQNSVLDSREGCNAIIDTDRRMVVRGCKASTIPEGIRHIGPYAFYQCQSLTSIQLPKSLISIREYAFTGCRSLVSVMLPPNLIIIDKYAFAHTAIKSIDIPEKLLQIRDGAFFETQIDEVTIPTPVDYPEKYYVGDFAFYRMGHQTIINYDKAKPLVLGKYYTKGQKGNMIEVLTREYNKTKLGELTEQDPIGLYHLTKVTYDEGSIQTVPDFEQYKYCARSITLTTQPERADDGTLTIPFLDNDRTTVFRHTGNVPVGTNGRGIRVYDSDSARFILKWFNSDRTESEIFPRDKFINEHYDAKEGIASDVRIAIDILEALSTLSPHTSYLSSLTGCWQRIGIVRMRQGVIAQFFPLIENPKYKLFYQQHEIDLYDMNITSSSYAEEVAPRFTLRMKTYRYDPNQQLLTEGTRTAKLDWKGEDTFLLPFLKEEDGTEYFELYEYSQLPERITNIFASK